VTTLFCFGLGYCARRYVADYGASYQTVVATSRSAELTDTPALGEQAVTMLRFDGVTASAAIGCALDHADRVVVSVPPSAAGDPVLAMFGDALAQCSRLQSVVYLSTIGVYGDHAGAEVDETTPPLPLSPRSRARLAAERAWRELGARIDKPVAILRLSGIYGPGRNPLVKLAEGRAKRIVKVGQVFNRVHVADVVQTIHAAFTRRADGVFNVTDDEPCSAEQVLLYCASLMGMEPPPAIPFCAIEASKSAMARSFYLQSTRVQNHHVKRELGVQLIYPTYRSGMHALQATHNPRTADESGACT
jgi:nucleoside-diphosphate-sugar epimerase